ncbi:RNA-directed DNA polymerase, eukaryota [Tanacetum coccineum]
MYSPQFSESPREEQSPVEEVDEIQVSAPKKKPNGRHQLAPTKKLKNQKGEDQRCIPWTLEEEIVLCKGWVRISEDSVVGNARRVEVTKHMHTTCLIVKRRTYDMFNGKWKTVHPKNVINRIVEKFESCERQGGEKLQEIQVQRREFVQHEGSGNGSFNLNSTAGDEEDDVQKVHRSRPIARDQGKRKAKAETSSAGLANAFDVELLAKLMVNDGGDVALYIKYNRLFHLDNNKDCVIRDRIANGNWSWDWSRSLITGRTQGELNNLILDIVNMDPDEIGEVDSCIWSLSQDATFSVSSARKHIDDCSLPTLLPGTRWYKMIPKKINIFMWRFFLDRLPNRLNLSSRGLDIDSIACPTCNGFVESNAHIFFLCNTASEVWHRIRCWCGSVFPTMSSCEDWDIWFQSWSASKDRKDRIYTIFAATCWTLWRFRNNITFNSHSMRKCDILDYILCFLFLGLNIEVNIVLAGVIGCNHLCNSLAPC